MPVCPPSDPGFGDGAVLLGAREDERAVEESVEVVKEGVVEVMIVGMMEAVEVMGGEDVDEESAAEDEEVESSAEEVEEGAPVVVALGVEEALVDCTEEAFGVVTTLVGFELSVDPGATVMVPTRVTVVMTFGQRATTMLPERRLLRRVSGGPVMPRQALATRVCVAVRDLMQASVQAAPSMKSAAAQLGMVVL